MPKKIINTHAHVFTGNFVPPFLAKTLVPWPFYYLIHTAAVVWLVKMFFKIKYGFRYSDSIIKDLFGNIKRVIQKVKFWVLGHFLSRLLFKVIILLIGSSALIYLIDCLAILFQIDDVVNSYLIKIKTWLSEKYVYFELDLLWKVIFILGVLLFIKPTRQPIKFLVGLIFPAIKKLFSASFLELLERYYLLGRFATTYSSQKGIAKRALNQLPKDSGMVILPMDMRFMKAGRTFPSKKQKEIAAKYGGKKIASNLTYKDKLTGIRFKDSYKYQMLELYDFTIDEKTNSRKEEYYPFLFLDPRRVKDEGKAFFDWEWKKDSSGNSLGVMELKNCFVKTYMEDYRFSGFKIYPALGYYCFDEYLLPIWRYAAEKQIPIMTHCIMGRIYYRGAIKEEWHYHPVFKEDDGESPKVLPETKHYDFQRNFTHPLNYLCLLEPDLLEGALLAAIEPAKSRAHEAFNYDPNPKKKGKGDLSVLSKLKICLAHYGGEEEWVRYMEQDREVYSQRLMRDPEEGIEFMSKSKNGSFSWPKINQLWEQADWYSIITSLLIRYENIYADLSYIISKESVYPLIKYSLEKGNNYIHEHEHYKTDPNPYLKGKSYTGKNKLRSRILFGTDFYVVRNHKSEKNLFVDLKTHLGEEDFDLIARENPFNYLARE